MQVPWPFTTLHPYVKHSADGAHSPASATIVLLLQLSTTLHPYVKHSADTTLHPYVKHSADVGG